MTAHASDPGVRSDRSSEERAAPAFYKRRKKRTNEIGQVLLRRGAIRPEQLREALRIQRDTGGLVGAILMGMGACDAHDIGHALLEQLRHRTSGHQGSTLALRASENPSIIGLLVRSKPGLTRALLLTTDAIGLFLAPLLAQWWVVGAASPGTRVIVALVVTLLATTGLAMTRLYSMTPPSPPEEIRRITHVVSLVYIGFCAVAWLEKTGYLAFGVRRGAWFVAWALSLVLVPLGRGLLRAKFAKKPWWGHPVVVLGAGKVGRALVGTLQNHPELGLKPVAILDDDPEKQGTLRASWGQYDISVDSVTDPSLSTPSVRAVWGQFSEVEGIPIVGGLDLAPALAQRLGIRCALVAMAETESAELVTTLERVGDGFTNVLLVPDLFNIAHFGAPAHSLGGLLGIEVRRQLLLAGARAAKRTMDLVLTMIGGLLVLPLLVVIAVLIRLDSPGPALYRQERLGQDGVRFQALKFRTMYGDGEERLAGLLASNPALRSEYEEFHKLSTDPRITHFGRWLRKYSLDELPQIYNVLRGDMSLVGPRPYLEREIPAMNQQEVIVLRAKPGITGIWQVTERNATGFERRVQIDFEYVRNWSPWLDIYVLARTFIVISSGTGA
jgi:lipopolysaccharide/colanic/teichoic acid biosynthesis glycosyltransferase